MGKHKGNIILRSGRVIFRRQRKASVQLVTETGDAILSAFDGAGAGIQLFLKALRLIGCAFVDRGRVMQQIYICGVVSIPVVTITAVFSGMVLAGQAGYELQKRLNDSSILGSLVGGSLCRELGPVQTAIMVAGLVGAGMASVLSSMKINEEIDALEAMSINPVRFLVVPRLVAMIIAMPLLTTYADMVGILGGALVGRYRVGVPYRVYFSGCWDFLEVKDYFTGLLKALVFGIIITAVSCHQGFTARGGAEGVGRATMRTVVYSFLLILVFNYLLFSLMY